MRLSLFDIVDKSSIFHTVTFDMRFAVKMEKSVSEE